MSEKRVEHTLQDLHKGKDFLRKIPVPEGIKPTINKYNIVKRESFCKEKEIVN